MDAIKITVKDKMLSIHYEESTPEKVRAYMNELKVRLGVTWFGICPIFGLEPNESNTRLMRKMVFER